MVKIAVTDIRTPGQQKKGKLGSLPDGQVICRSMHRHDYPSDSLAPSATRLPKGMTVGRVRGGGYSIRDECRRCGKVRTYTTKSGALWDFDTHYSYKNPGDWVTFHGDDGFEVSTGDFKAELFERRAELIKANAIHEVGTRPERGAS